ncbi:glycosyl hydrolase [Lentilactobacillus fungorum]|uniref:Glycosyl hydrolase n=1 Tax=Lentilactobacillus fungorum TaxID=2201250 RepID=A0ABQ3VZW4_9LACO|nr:beta-L-arabinofuranosidase domain-containing protein [Lentilactobacillus fungorum]GHP13756.1 glycosyl hydrolase [Lentilactobacillus fungorum]
MIKNVNFNQITIDDGDLIKRRDNTVRYLLTLDPERFLFEFYKVAGLKPTTQEGYGGWERSDDVNFRGHFFGHYLSALAQGLSTVNDEQQRSQIHQLLLECVSGLEKVQTAYAKKHPQSAGYISAFREVALDEVQGDPVPAAEKDNVIVPWYNLHKILAGLLKIAAITAWYDRELAARAQRVAAKFGDYVYNRMMKLTDPQQMLKTEYGGMNDALYELFSLTHNPHHLKAATYFDEVTLFEQLAENQDVLPGLHANTTIPKLIGALRRYQLFSNNPDADQFLSKEAINALPMYLKAAANFFEIVTKHHSYVIGGNSQSEHFHDPDSQYHDAELADGGKTCETCNSYNMLKLARELFRTTGKQGYLDYYERTFVNAILGSQNLATGMTTYFQPMAAGYNKVFNRPYDDFWCCTGTGIENHTKLSDSLYYGDAHSLVISLYFANQLALPEQNLKLDLTTNQLRNHIKVVLNPISPNKSVGQIDQLKLRIPTWSRQTKITVNGQQVQANADGFAYLKNVMAGSKITLQFKMQLATIPASDNEHYIAFKYGPYVLAGLLGTYRIKADRPDGILVRIAAKDQTADSTLTTADDWTHWQNKLADEQLEDTSGNTTLTLPDTEENLKFVPYYQVYDQRYGVYFQWQQKGSVEAKMRAKQVAAVESLRKRTVAELTNFDNNNGEFEHHLEQAKSEVGPSRNRRYRVAQPGGKFSYEFDIRNAHQSMYLVLTLNQQVDEGRQLILTFNDQPASATVIVNHPQAQPVDDRGFYELRVPIPTEVTQKDKVKLTFTATKGMSPRLYGIRFENKEA